MDLKSKRGETFPALLPCRASRFRLGGEEYVVFSMPAARALSPAERDVARLIIDGRSNAEIARLRESAVRTVANQVANIFRKVGIDRRAELVALRAMLPAMGGSAERGERAR